MTRALACLLKGDLALALNFHPLSPLALTALLIMFLGGPCRIVWERTGWRTYSKGERPILLGRIAAALPGLWLLEDLHG